jgi:hypothetical protein
MKTVVGMILLLLGGAVAVYGFNAPDSVNPHLSGIFVGVPTLKTIALLWGGSAVAVIGGNMALPPSNKV